MNEDEEPWCPVIVADARNREDVPITMLSAVTLPVRQVFLFEIRSVKGDVL